MYFDADGRRVSCDKDDTPQFSETGDIIHILTLPLGIWSWAGQ